jgi:hypothetical protein
MVHMACAYLTEKQMPRTFWFYAIVHAARMMNAIPGKHYGHLVSLFLLVHGVSHDDWTWILFFSLCYFHQDWDGNHQCSKTWLTLWMGSSLAAHLHQICSWFTIRIITILWTGFLLHWPLPPPRLGLPGYQVQWRVVFLPPPRCKSTVWGEKIPPGTRIERLDPTTNILLSSTVMDIPFSQDTSMQADDEVNRCYTILFDNGTTNSITLSKMSSLNPPPLFDVSPLLNDDALLPPFLCLSSLITYKHDGQYHKGYLSTLDGVYWYSYKSHMNKQKEDWGVPLPNLLSTWVDLCVEGDLIPGHISHSFLRSLPSPTLSTFDLVASFVSAVNLHQDCPPSLIKALEASYPDREVWLQSFYEEKQGIESLGTFRKIMLGEYWALRKKGAPKAISTMCILTIKKYENLLPLCAKSYMVVLGNHEDPVWFTSERFALVLCQDSLCFLVSLTVASCWLLHQGDCKNMFNQGILPDNEITIVRPPASNPKAAPDEYWLLQGPCMASDGAPVTGMIK